MRAYIKCLDTHTQIWPLARWALLVPCRFLQLAHKSCAARQRAVLWAWCSVPAGGGGVPPVSLCVLIEVFLPLNPAIFPPPCWLEEDERGEEWTWQGCEGRVSYQALLPLARCSSLIVLLCSTWVHKHRGSRVWWRGCCAVSSVSGNRTQQES